MWLSPADTAIHEVTPSGTATGVGMIGRHIIVEFSSQDMPSWPYQLLWSDDQLLRPACNKGIDGDTLPTSMHPKTPLGRRNSPLHCIQGWLHSGCLNTASVHSHRHISARASQKAVWPPQLTSKKVLS